MAIQKEIWMAAIVEGLFASNSFLSKAFNADEYVNNGKIVHIPNAGAASGTKKNRTELPAKVTKRTDIDVTFPLDEYTTDPVLIPNADTVELSYDKRESVLRNDKLKLQDDVALDFIFNWSPAAAQCVETTGAEIDAYTDKATGKRKSICKADILGLMTKFNNDDIPQEGRYLLLDAQMYSQLLNSLTENENTAFLASADAQNGILGKQRNRHRILHGSRRILSLKRLGKVRILYCPFDFRLRSIYSYYEVRRRRWVLMSALHILNPR